MSDRLLTASDFEYFKSRCHYWLRELGQARWRVSFSFQKFRGKTKSANAFVWTTTEETFLAKFFLNKNYCVEPGFGLRASLDADALHECLHVLFYESKFPAGKFDYEHEAVHVLVKLALGHH